MPRFLTLKIALGQWPFINVINFHWAFGWPTPTSIQYLSDEMKVTALRKDILKGPSHDFVNTSHCEKLGYFCKGKQKMANYIPDMI